MDQLPDSSLIELAQGGDQHAFAELYTRYFDPVYDFVARMTRNRDEAADIAQDTFLKAMNALGGLQKGASFKSWIFTIARNTALNRIEKSSRVRPLTFEGEDGEEVGFDVVDTDRFSDPEEAAQASAVSALVWEAAAGLDPKQLSLLDLHLRQGLDSGEIADVLGVTKNNGYVMLNRLKKAVEDSIGAFIMLKDGRQYCDDLDFALKGADIQGMSPEARKVVERHVAQCRQCEERKRKLAPLAAFAALGAIGAPMGAKAHILDGLLQQWPGPAAGGGASGGGGSTGGGGGSTGYEGGMFFGKGAFPRKFLVPFLGGLAAVLMALLFVPQSPLALIKDSDDDGQQAIIEDPSGGTGGDPTKGQPTTGPGTPTPTAASSSTATASPSASPSGSPSPSTTALPGQAGTPTATATATRTNTPVPTPGPGTPTFTPSPTPTRTNTPTATPTTCAPFLSGSTPSLNIAPGGSASFQVFNGTGCSTIFSAQPQGAPWLGASGGGTIGPSGTATVNVTVSDSAVPSTPGTYSGSVLIAWTGGSFAVSVSTTRTGVPPVISSAGGSCTAPTFGPSTSSWNATVSDDGTVQSVRVMFDNTDHVPMVVSLVNAGGNAWRAINGPNARNGSNYRVVATDNVGLSSTLAFTPGSSCFP